MKTNALSDDEINFLMYQYAASVLAKEPSLSEFNLGREIGQFNFLENKALLPDLMELYKFNLQFLCNEWLASNDKMSFFGKTPMRAAAQFIIALAQKNKSLVAL